MVTFPQEHADMGANTSCTEQNHGAASRWRVLAVDITGFHMVHQPVVGDRDLEVSLFGLDSSQFFESLEVLVHHLLHKPWREVREDLIIEDGHCFDYIWDDVLELVAQWDDTDTVSPHVMLLALILQFDHMGSLA